MLSVEARDLASHADPSDIVSRARQVLISASELEVAYRQAGLAAPSASSSPEMRATGSELPARAEAKRQEVIGIMEDLAALLQEPVKAEGSEAGSRRGSLLPASYDEYNSVVSQQ